MIEIVRLYPTMDDVDVANIPVHMKLANIDNVCWPVNIRFVETLIMSGIFKALKNWKQEYLNVTPLS